MIEKHHSQLSVRKQCELLAVNRNRLSSRRPKRVKGDEVIMKEIDRIYTEFPFYGARKIVAELRDVGIRVGRKRCRRLMKVMGIEALVPKPSTSIPDKQHRKYPYLLRGAAIAKPDEVWAADITYVPMYEGHVYLVAIMDWHTRAVLSWRVSTTMDASFCVEAYRDAMRVAGRAPEIMNTDQGSQFTGEEWIEAVEASGARVSMDGKGRWMDNVFIERLWRSLKYEELRLWSYETVADVTARIAKWMTFYNHRRKHQALDNQVPWSRYRPGPTGDDGEILTLQNFPPRGTEARAA
jgi:putative transposase